jgi:hypothetical protein
MTCAAGQRLLCCPMQIRKSQNSVILKKFIDKKSLVQVSQMELNFIQIKAGGKKKA